MSYHPRDAAPRPVPGPMFANGEHVLVLIDFLVYRATITQVLRNYALGHNAYVVTLHDGPAYMPSSYVVIEGAVGNEAIVGRPSAALDWADAVDTGADATK